ncbi:MAG TPA: aspartate-semialdehyde dehydrogenase [Firmicutes bacterium]|nr:aspartate-semialdehyde dehydrogenase [Candidatus Fermentithermobacillaceae bacterium]
MVKLAVVGAGGLVGKRVVSILDKNPIPGLELYLTGHSKSVGTKVEYRGQTLRITKTDSKLLRKADIVLLCTPTQASIELVSLINGGPVVIDTSSAFRMEAGVPLVVPEVNGHEVFFHKGLVSGPNCSTIQLVMSLYPIHEEFGLSRVHVSTYQSVSGAGYRAMDELEKGSFEQITAGSYGSREDSGFPHPIAFNLIPQIDGFDSEGYTREEMKMVNETRKILGIPDLAISCTCVRVPVFIGHSEACLVETQKQPCIETIRERLNKFPGVVVMDDPPHQVYPTPLQCQDTDEVYVGRLRRDLSSNNGVLYWLVADNLRRGAATNACNIVRALVGERR